MFELKESVATNNVNITNVYPKRNKANNQYRLYSESI